VLSDSAWRARAGYRLRDRWSVGGAATFSWSRYSCQPGDDRCCSQKSSHTVSIAESARSSRCGGACQADFDPVESEQLVLMPVSIANRLLSYPFSWLLNQRYNDTLCGTKVMRRSDCYRLKKGKVYFGDFDPFGDFDLIFGASKLNLKIVDLPIRYAARAYGENQISWFQHGFLLLKMVVFAFFKIKVV
jgi:hypothetical protein